MIRGAATDDTNIIFGATIDERLTGQVWVTVVATGLGGGRARPREPSSFARELSGRRPGEERLEPPSFLRDASAERAAGPGPAPAGFR